MAKPRDGKHSRKPGARSQKPERHDRKEAQKPDVRRTASRKKKRVKLGHCFLLTSGSWLLASAERHAFKPKQSCSTRLGASGDCAGPARSRAVDGGGSPLRGQAPGGAANLPH